MSEVGQDSVSYPFQTASLDRHNAVSLALNDLVQIGQCFVKMRSEQTDGCAVV